MSALPVTLLPPSSNSETTFLPCWAWPPTKCYLNRHQRPATHSRGLRSFLGPSRTQRSWSGLTYCLQTFTYRCVRSLLRWLQGVGSVAVYSRVVVVAGCQLDCRGCCSLLSEWLSAPCFSVTRGGRERERERERESICLLHEAGESIVSLHLPPWRWIMVFKTSLDIGCGQSLEH